MCFNKESSFITWVVAWTFGIVLLQKGLYWKGLFLLTFSLIQLLEAIAWYSIENNNETLNSNTTKMILLALWLQPIVNVVCVINFTNIPQHNKFKYLLGALMLTFLFSLYKTTEDKFKTYVGPNGHLIWKTNDTNNLFSNDTLTALVLGAIYIIGLCLPLVFMENNIGPLVVTGGTMLWSFYNYWKTKEFSSMWCFTAATLAIVYVLENDILISD